MAQTSPNFFFTTLKRLKQLPKLSLPRHIKRSSPKSVKSKNTGSANESFFRRDLLEPRRTEAQVATHGTRLLSVQVLPREPNWLPLVWHSGPNTRKQHTNLLLRTENPPNPKSDPRGPNTKIELLATYNLTWSVEITLLVGCKNNRTTCCSNPAAHPGAQRAQKDRIPSATWSTTS